MEEELECEENEDIIFAEAKEFLRIVQPKTSIPRGQVSTSAESQSKDAKRKTVQFGGKNMLRRFIVFLCT